MRIGELAALVGASARTVRHDHHLGCRPERRANGYREYRLRGAVERGIQLNRRLDEPTGADPVIPVPERRPPTSPTTSRPGWPP